MMVCVCVSFAEEYANHSSATSSQAISAAPAADPVAKNKEKKPANKAKKSKKAKKAVKKEYLYMDSPKHMEPDGMRIPRKGDHTEP